VRYPNDTSASGSGRRALRETIESALRRTASSGFLLSIDLTSSRGRPRSLDEGDDELAPLSVSSYTSHRIDAQLAYFRNRGQALRRQALAIIIIAVVLAAASGWVAGTYYAPWATIAVLGVTALTAFLERSRLTDRAGRYSTASADLAQIKAGLDVEGAASWGQPEKLYSAVYNAEGALEAESLAWEQLVWRDVREARQN
jgi:hypothetical protein